MTDINLYSNDKRPIGQIIREDIFPHLAHAFPKQATHDISTMGGRVMNFLGTVFPWKTTLSTSRIIHISEHIERYIHSKEQQQALIKAYDLWETLLKKQKSEIFAAKTCQQTFNAVQQYRLLTCSECSLFAAALLDKYGYHPHVLHYNILNLDKGVIDIAHATTIYSENREMSLDDMMNNLKDPAVRIVDYWMGIENNAYEALCAMNDFMIEPQHAGIPFLIKPLHIFDNQGQFIQIDNNILTPDQYIFRDGITTKQMIFKNYPLINKEEKISHQNPKGILQKAASFFVRYLDA